MELGRQAGEFGGGVCRKQFRLQVEVEARLEAALEVGRHEGGRDLRERERPAGPVTRIEIGGERGLKFWSDPLVGGRELHRAEADADGCIIEIQAGLHLDLVHLAPGRAPRLNEKSLEPAEAQADVEHEIEVERGRAADRDPEPVEADVEFALADRDLPRSPHRDREDHAVTESQITPAPRQIVAGLRAVGPFDCDAVVFRRRIDDQVVGGGIGVERLRDVASAFTILDVLLGLLGYGVVQRFRTGEVPTLDPRTDVLEERHL